MTIKPSLSFKHYLDVENQNHLIWFEDMHGNEIDGLSGITDVSEMSQDEFNDMIKTLEETPTDELLALFGQRFDEYKKGMVSSSEVH